MGAIAPIHFKKGEIAPIGFCKRWGLIDNYQPSFDIPNSKLGLLHPSIEIPNNAPVSILDIGNQAN